MDIVVLVEKFGFTTIMVVGLGYFVYYVWQTITNTIDPAVSEMKKTIIRLTDQLRLLDQDMIRLQEKVNTVLELNEKEPDNPWQNWIWLSNMIDAWRIFPRMFLTVYIILLYKCTIWFMHLHEPSFEQ